MSPVPSYFTGDFAISFWERAQTATNTRMHALSLGSTATDNLDFDFDGGVGLWVFWRGGGGNAIKVGHVGEFTDGSWHHVLLQRSGAQVQLHVDGILRGVTVYSQPIGSQSLMRIGRSSSGAAPSWAWGAYWWCGAIDDVRVYGRALLGTEIFTLADSIRALYLFTGNANEESGRSAAGVVSGAVASSNRFGETASAYQFNGTDASIAMPSMPAYFPGDFAMSFWEKAPAATNTRMHALSLGSSSYDNLDFDFNDGAGLLVFWRGGGGNSIAVGQNGDFTDGFWHHVLLQRSGAQVQLYVDGSLKGTTVYDGPMGSPALMSVGRSSAGADPSWSWGAQWWRGFVDDVRIEDRVLDSNEIAARARLYVRLAAGAHGNINGSGEAQYGDTPTYTMAPDPGYKILDVMVGNVSVGAVVSYTFAGGITAPVTISASFAVIPLADSVTGAYSFNGTAGEDNGRTAPGVISGAVLTSDRLGQAASVYEFNGTNASIGMSSVPAYFTGDFAISFWERARTATNARMHALSLGSTATDNLDFDFNDGVGLWVFWGGGGANRIAVGRPGEFTDGSWHHVLLQRRGAQVQLYVDGILKGAAVYGQPIGSPSFLRIGRSSAGAAPPWSWPAHWWRGAIDDVRIYDRALAKEQIVSLVYQWTRVTPSGSVPFPPRDGAGGLSFHGRMWILGGWDPGMTPSTNSEIWSSTDGVIWSLAGIAPWEGRHAAGYAVHRDKMWIVGGDNNSGHYQNDVWSSGDGVNWELVTNTAPWANRATHHTLVFDDKLWVMGGQEVWSASGEVIYNDVYFSSDGVDWTQATPHAGWTPRGSIIGSVVFQEKMWVIGGGTYDVRRYNNDVWASADGVSWEQVTASAAWDARIYHNVGVFAEKMWVLAGVTQSAAGLGGSNDVWYSSDGVVWTQLPDTPWAIRHAATVVNYGNGLWLMAGSAQSLYDDVWMLTYAR